jgi:hypothetical protein
VIFTIGVPTGLLLFDPAKIREKGIAESIILEVLILLKKILDEKIVYLF